MIPKYFILAPESRLCYTGNICLGHGRSIHIDSQKIYAHQTIKARYAGRSSRL